MAKDLLVPENGWRQYLGLKRRTATRVNIQILNAVPNPSGTLHRWLHRGDVLDLMYREAERTESRDIRLLADRIREATAKE